MIIDADTHISPYKDKERIQMEKLIELMDTSHVDKALTWLHEPYMRVLEESNTYVYEAVKKYPDRLIGFGWLDPHFGRAHCLEVIKKGVEEYNFPGFKMNGSRNEFYYDDAEMSLPLAEELAKRGLILAFHVGSDAFDATHPYRVEKIAKMFPEMTILMVHMGGVGKPDMTMACIDIAKRNPNLHLIGSHVNLKCVAAAIDELGAERVSFGSDTPFTYMHSEVNAYKALLEDLYTPRERELVMGGNMRRLLSVQ